MSLLKEFEINNNAVEEWLPWGGITRPGVMQQKDGSYFSVIEYETKFTKKLEMPQFRRGWAIWNEHQHTSTFEKDFMVVCRNPFEGKNDPYVENTLGEATTKTETLKFFSAEIASICKEISKVTQMRLLKYQELVKFLSFTLRLEKVETAMPEVPLYMDALLSQDVKFDFKANDIYIDGERIFLVTLPDLPSAWEIFDKVKEKTYRYVRRLLLFDGNESDVELQKYVRQWCSGRKIMLAEIEQGILSKFNGYCWNGFIFKLSNSEYEKFRSDMEEYLTAKEMAYIFEHYNLKDVWWGSLPGIYLANITPPIIGFESVEEFILKKA